MNQEPKLPQAEDASIPQESGDAAPDAAPAVPFGKKAIAGAFDILEMFAISVFAVLIIFTFFVRLCRVEGGSMENTLYDGQYLLLYSLTYTPEQDDIVVFHLTDEDGNGKTMVKRVIATGGETIEINFEKRTVLVDGELYDDAHAILKDRFTDEITERYDLFANHHYDAATKTLSATVPEGKIFVMGDNRNNSKDSRNDEVGFVDSRAVLGKAVFRLNPFTKLS